MPKMMLSETEADLVRKHRENERHYNAGWNAALEAATDNLEQFLDGDSRVAMTTTLMNLRKV